jgi:hypothetical protein
VQVLQRTITGDALQGGHHLGNGDRKAGDIERTGVSPGFSWQVMRQ